MIAEAFSLRGLKGLLPYKANDIHKIMIEAGNARDKPGRRNFVFAGIMENWAVWKWGDVL